MKYYPTETSGLYNNRDETQKHYTQQKTPDSQDCILCDSIYIKF